MKYSKDLRKPIPLENYNSTYLIPGSNIEICEYIGCGSSSLCYLARKNDSNQYCVVKEWYPYEFANEECYVLERKGVNLVITNSAPELINEIKNSYYDCFENEVDISKNIKYTKTQNKENNDLTVFGCYEILDKTDFPSKFLVVETSSGEVLSKKHCGSIEEIVETTKRISERIQELHNKGYLHLDLKPENIYVTDASIEDSNKISNHIFILLDYGSSVPHIKDEFGTIDKNKAKILTTTLKYAAPELLNADINHINFSTDIYSITKIMFWLLGFNSDVRNLRKEVQNNIFLKNLSPVLQNIFISFFNESICLRTFKNVGEFNDKLSKIFAILNDKGISTALIKKRSFDLYEKNKIKVDEKFLGDIEVIAAKE